MNTVEKLDLAIKSKEKGTVKGGYTIHGEERVKSTYMENAEWLRFKDAMKQNPLQPEAYTEYGNGGGDELTDKNGRPPKMACYGSSSRMIYKLSSHVKGFHYEEKLSTTVGGVANLDGFYEDDNRYIFVEAKCHEPYTAKKATVSKSYEKLYEYITEKMSSDLCINMKSSKCGKYLDVEFFAKEQKLAHFDMKQMICHLLGVATKALKENLLKKEMKFIYLLYDPSSLAIDPDAKKEIDAIYQKTCEECRSVDYQMLYRVILDFLRAKKFKDASESDVSAMTSNFNFRLMSQDEYTKFFQALHTDADGK